MNEFDRIAPWYRFLERAAFGRALERCRLAHVRSLKDSRRALILGEGDGRFAAEFLGVAEHCRADVVESSQRMIDLAQKRLAARCPRRRRQVRFLHQDARNLNLELELKNGPYDLTVTLFFLDCFPLEVLNQLIPNLAAATARDAHWLWADFVSQPSGWQKWRSRAWLRIMYQAFGVVANLKTQTLIDALPMIEAQGFTIVQDASFQSGFIRACLLRKR